MKPTANYWAVFSLVFVCLFALGGCNTAPMWADGQKVDGPTVNRYGPENIELPDIQIVEAKEVDLVEEVLTHRSMYHRTLRALRDYFGRSSTITGRQPTSNSSRSPCAIGTTPCPSTKSPAAGLPIPRSSTIR